jgi:DNA-binding transcriptional LysR family regulator
MLAGGGPRLAVSLSSLHLDAFVAVAEARHFTRAARALGLTQSALSQRVLNLESDVGTALFVRTTRAKGGVELTAAGERLLAYARTKRDLEADALAAIKGEDYRRTVRVAGYSSVTRSVVIPALGKVLRDVPTLDAECLTREMRELPGLLFEGRADYVIVDHPIAGARVVKVPLGHEELVLVERARHGGHDRAGERARRDVYLDHDEDDTTTETFFLAQRGRPGQKFPPRPASRRAFVDDIDGILAALAEGWGRAVIPRHLLGPRAQGDGRTRGLRVVPRHTPVRTPVILHFLEREPATRLHQAVVLALTNTAAAVLG